MKKTVFLIAALFVMGMFTACGEDQDGREEEGMIEVLPQKEQVTDQAESEPEKVEALESNAEKNEENDTTDDTKTAEMRERFGENCIADQTFEVEISEYEGKVYFVPFAPEGEEGLKIQILQNGGVLADIRTYVPKELEGEKFSSLDAVAFFDVNYDDNTDIVLIETYADTSFAAIYYGFDRDAQDYDRYFMAEENLSENVSGQVETLSIPEIRSLLTGDKKNGDFQSWQEAYRAVSRLCDLETQQGRKYNLIYFDDDDIPELVAGAQGYYVSLYTYCDGKVYPLMDQWAYGAMGNAGYEYSERKNSLRNYNADFAGAIYYATYMRMNEQHVMEIVTQIETYNFDDVNGNGQPDEEEEGSLGNYSVSYIDGVEVSADECASYNVGEYEYIEPVMDLKELNAVLDQ